MVKSDAPFREVLAMALALLDGELLLASQRESLGNFDGLRIDFDEEWQSNRHSLKSLDFEGRRRLLTVTDDAVPEIIVEEGVWREQYRRL